MRVKFFSIASIFLIIPLFAIAKDTLKNVKCTQNGKAQFSDSEQYKVEYCKDYQCNELYRPELKEKLSKGATALILDNMDIVLRRGYEEKKQEIDSWKSSAADGTRLIKILSADYSSGDGASPWKATEIEKLKKYLDEYKDALHIEYIHVVSNYMGGTGVSNHFVIYNAKLDTVTLIEKFEYAE